MWFKKKKEETKILYSECKICGEKHIENKIFCNKCIKIREVSRLPYYFSEPQKKYDNIPFEFIELIWKLEELELINKTMRDKLYNKIQEFKKKKEAKEKRELNRLKKKYLEN